MMSDLVGKEWLSQEVFVLKGGFNHWHKLYSSTDLLEKLGDDDAEDFAQYQLELSWMFGKEVTKTDHPHRSTPPKW
eukprot:4474552-Amphidinium_carterae.1